MATKETFGKVLKTCRDEKGMTQEDLATKSKLSRVQIARLETDEQSPSWKTVKILCRILGVSCELFAETADPPKKDDAPPTGKRQRGRPRKGE